MVEEIEYNGQVIQFCIQKKKIKNMYIKVNSKQEVIVSMPINFKKEFAKKFVKEKVNWIVERMNKYENNSKKIETFEFKDNDEVYILGKKYKIKLYKDKQNKIIINEMQINMYIKDKFINNSQYKKKIYYNWLKEFAIDFFKDLTVKYQNEMKKYKIPMPEIEVKSVKSKWGSCTPSKKKVMFNLSLIKTSIECIQYVVVHELAHFRYQNHSREFYNFVSYFIPNYKQIRITINKEYAGII